MFRKILLTTALLTVLILAGAREFWLQPVKFFFNPGEKFLVGFKVGENFMGEPWDLEKSSIEALELHQLSTSVVLKDSVKKVGKDDLSYSLKNEGTYLLEMQSTNAFIESSADNFNDYLKDAGLDDVLYHRQKNNSMSSPGKENFSIYTKLLVQVGEKRDDTYKKVLGFPAEIIPQKNPYALKIGEKIRFKILFDGKPVFGARVKVWNRSDNRTTIQNIYTEKDGTIEAIISGAGPWMISVARMVASKQPSAEWQSYRGSLVFGINK